MPRALTSALAVLAVVPSTLPAQHDHHDQGILALARARAGSGTTWLPDAYSAPGYHAQAGSWELMLHGAAFLQYVRATGTRESAQLGSANWLMAMAERTTTRDALRFRLMATAEPFTIPGAGYPQLLQVAHEYRGALAPDRQHPHELVAELSVTYEHALSEGLAASVYAAPVGEPALGPVAYNHRPSAQYEPVAPLGHIAQDYTHESLGVLTAGLFSSRIRIEASVFNSAHPDDRRTNLDFQGGRLESYAGRVTVAPSRSVTAAAWLAYAAESPDHDHGAHHVFGGSLLLTRARPAGTWSSALIYGAKKELGERALATVLLESSLDVSRTHAVFTRLEYAQRSDEEIGLTGSVPPVLDVMGVSLGYALRLRGRALAGALGARVTAHVMPAALEPFYGRSPLGLLVFLRATPPAP